MKKRVKLSIFDGVVAGGFTFDDGLQGVSSWKGKTSECSWDAFTCRVLNTVSVWTDDGSEWGARNALKECQYSAVTKWLRSEMLGLACLNEFIRRDPFIGHAIVTETHNISDVFRALASGNARIIIIDEYLHILDCESKTNRLWGSPKRYRTFGYGADAIRFLRKRLRAKASENNLNRAQAEALFIWVDGELIEAAIEHMTGKISNKWTEPGPQASENIRMVVSVIRGHCDIRWFPEGPLFTYTSKVSTTFDDRPKFKSRIIYPAPPENKQGATSLTGRLLH